MSAHANGPNGGRSRRLPALRLDDDGTANTVSGRVDKTVPLAIYGGSTAQGRLPLTTTEGAAPITPTATSAVQAPLPASTTAPGVVAAQEDNTVDDIDGPPLTKTPWGLLVAGLVVVVVLGGAVALFLVLGSGEKKASEPPRPNGSATALPATSATPLP